VRETHLLVLGAGSVGKRQLSNFSSLGCMVSAMDPRGDRLTEAARLVPLVRTFSDLETALSQAAIFSGAVVCSPPKFHVEQALAVLEKGLPVLLEKPVSPDAESAACLVETVRRRQIPLLLDYTFRWWPPIRELRSRLQQGVVGKVLHVRGIMSAHLADWHPWERYQDFFMASRELGGGALLDESHFVDLMIWLFGMPVEVFAKVERLSSLEIQTDDNVDVWLRCHQGVRISVHLDLYGRPHERSITVTGEQGTLQWSFEANSLRFSRSSAQEWEETRYSCERNDMFVDAAKEFLQIIDTGQRPSCSIEDGYAVLRVIEAMRQSSATGRVVSVDSLC